MYCFLKSAAKVKLSFYNKLKTNLIFHIIGKNYAVLLIINVFFSGIICSFPKKTLPFALAIGYWLLAIGYWLLAIGDGMKKSLYI